ncbi:SagB/ThcOx family dehydrogenase [Embleya sp. AB8]|uniref:SagB/ThcOx family dehydrogenase n=1 Tax=Embleya sp. AB8 TaxID=3156304 RepID=UPI003C771A4D
MSMRRARSIVCYWHENSFVVENYRTRTTSALDPMAAALLHELGDWIDEEKIAARFPDFDAESVRESIAALREVGLVVRRDDPEADRDDAVGNSWTAWHPCARYMHAMTKDVPFVDPTVEIRERLAGESAAPALFKSYPDADLVLLPRVPRRFDASFDEVLYARRTHRSFAAREVPLEDFATLLATVFGPTGFIDADAFGGLMQRTSASGGARQEIEAYLAVRRVAHLEPGIYHYNVLKHGLEFLKPSPPWERIARLGVDQPGIEQAAFVVVLTSLVERLQAKYKTARAYRVMLMNAGHFGQTFALTATALGLGPFQTAAFTDTELEALLDLDGVTETAVYLLGAGVPGPPTRPDGTDTPKPPAGLTTFRRTRLDAGAPVAAHVDDGKALGPRLGPNHRTSKLTESTEPVA